MEAFEIERRDVDAEVRGTLFAVASPAPHLVTGTSGGAYHRGCLVERIGAERFDAIADAWRDLADRSAEPNALYAFGFATAAVRLLNDASGFEAAAVWRPLAEGARLIGLFPFRSSPWRWGLPLGLASGMAHNYSPLGTPLLDPTEGIVACEAFLEWLGPRGLNRRFLLMPGLPQEGRAARMLRTAFLRGGLGHHGLDPRDHVLAQKRPDSYIAASMSSKKRAQLRWQRRRLEEQGTITFEVATTPEDVAGGIEDFLRLEAEGWKGRAGTASTQRPDRLAFVRRAVAGMAADRLARVYLLKLDGRAIATAIMYVQGGRGWLWKIAYDETLARFSPGVQMMVSLTDDLLGDPSIFSLDSLAEAPHQMLSHVWRERLALDDWLVDLTPGGSILMPVALFAERNRRQLHGILRSLVARLRQFRR
jgi:CelD/BcsL family acetyltransferase involved in cellulose biosynthesis